MIVVDTSAVIAILAREPEQTLFRHALLQAGARSLSTATYVEVVLITEGKRLGTRAGLDRWLDERQIDVVPVDLAIARLAADAFVRFGKGRHPAGLNYGDCFAYALARRLGAPLLYKGDDFARTDVASALA